VKKDLTELVFILDMSGSMAHLTDDTIGGFNSVLKEHNDGRGEVLVTTYLFNNDSKMIHDRLPIASVPPMTEKDYSARGCTALLDAIGGAINHIVGIHRYIREEDIPEHTIFVITTDGMENASHKYSADHIRDKIRHEQDKYGWEFLFLAANIDAIETAEAYGIDKSRAVNYHADREGTEQVYEAVNCATRIVRERRRLSEDSSWRKNIDTDFKNRKK
jgi:hypothetical protein